MKRACADGDEQDAFTGWRHVLHWRRGELRKIKRRAGKRERRTAKVVIRQERADGIG
jgi:hypothetical protein